MASTVLPNGIIIPEKYSRDWYADLYHNWQELDNLLGGGTPKDGTLTIQKNGDTVGTFSANQATDETIDITVPTKTSDLTNDSNFVQSSDLATVATSGSYNDLSNKPTIPTVNNATLTIQQNGTTVDTFTANASADKTININTADDTKIPLAGSNAISGSLIPATTDSVNLGSSAKEYLNAYIKSLIINGTAAGDILTHNASEFVPRSGGAVISGTMMASTTDNMYVTYCGGNSFDNGAFVRVHGKDYTDPYYAGTILIRAKNNSNVFDLFLKPDGTAMWGNKNLAMQEDVVPRSGGYVMTGTTIGRNISNSSLTLRGSNDTYNGGTIIISGKDASSSQGCIDFYPRTSATVQKNMQLAPNGTWTWTGTACQITSDQRLKQQITEIDDKLLDAWEDVELSQFKYNESVDTKGKSARLHTGYVVQQIDSACKSHGVDVSAYGLYCHEEYPEETEEVEVEQADGTKVKETKVIREASEHYSLRYTEVYAVECMYLRRCIARLTARIEELEKGNNTK